MPFELFDRSQLQLKALDERIHDLGPDTFQDPDHVHLPEHSELSEHGEKTIDLLADRIIAAREKNASVIMAMGGHCIRAGNGILMAELARRGLVTHFALNGACAIHDFEFAMIGSTTESVAKYISEGQFGLWKETGKLNDAAVLAVQEGYGYGERLGKMIEDENFKYRKESLLAAGYRYHVPVTVHVGLGCDIIHEHPNCDGAALGQASYTDFLIYAKTIQNLENGVFMDFGSAVIGPEVYLKALSMARNVAKQHGEEIAHFTTAVFDLHDLEGKDIHEAPPKNDPRYYFRPWKTIMARTVADGGESHYVCGRHNETVPRLYLKLLEKSNGKIYR